MKNALLVFCFLAIKARLVKIKTIQIDSLVLGQAQVEAIDGARMLEDQEMKASVISLDVESLILFS